MSMTSNHLIDSINKTLCLTASAHLLYSLYYDYSVIRIPTQFEWAGKIVYLTFWNLCIESFYFTFAALENFLSNSDSKDYKKIGIFLRRIRDSSFIIIVFPFSMLVSTVYWGMSLTIDRALLHPNSQSRVSTIPVWFNHSVHSLISIYSVAELVTTYHNTSISITKQLRILYCLSISYAVCCVATQYMSGSWAYPFLNQLTWPGRILFFATIETLFTAFFFLGSSLNNLIWKKTIAETTEKSKKK